MVLVHIKGGDLVIYIKVNNVFVNNQADYKGLDIDKIVGGTQIYPPNENYCVFQYDGYIVAHNDLQEISESEYKVIYDNRPKPELEIIKERQDLMQAALDDFILSGGVF